MTTETGAVPTTRTDAPNPAPPRIMSSEYLWITIGACALVFLGAFESLAVTTVMPTVSADLDGERLYALAFAGPLATSVIGMVIAGNWSDRRGPVAPLYTSVAMFVVGLLIAGLAPSMEILVAGRFAQGLGSGGLMVALYVVVARVYPQALHPAVFAGFAAAWVIPSLIGPTVAGAVTELWSWHWVFLGVVILVLVALFMVIPALRGLSNDGDATTPWAFGRLGWSVLAAVAVLALNLVGDIPGVGTALAAVAVVVALIAVRPLVPRGTLRAHRGLPSVILVRGLAAAAFFGAQVYLPYLLTDRYDLTPTLAGLSLTGGALAWSAAATVQGRMGTRLSSITAVRVGTILVLIGIALTVATMRLRLGCCDGRRRLGRRGSGDGTDEPPHQRVDALDVDPREPGLQQRRDDGRRLVRQRAGVGRDRDALHRRRRGRGSVHRCLRPRGRRGCRRGRAGTTDEDAGRSG